MRSIRAIRTTLLPLCALALIAAVALSARAQDKDKQPAVDAKAAFDAIRTLAGEWESTEPGPNGQPGAITFKVTANNSMIIETMFPGQKHEMINTYHMDGDSMIVTHYCAQGVQPRMKLVSFEDNTAKFEFMDCTNLKPGDGHMGGLELVIEEDKLTERWSYIQDGQPAGDPTVFELVKKG